MTTWNNEIRPGKGWLYDQPGITYDGATDELSGNEVFYDSLGHAVTWTNETDS